MEYTVILTQQPDISWRAAVPALPDCVEEASTRDEVLKKIQQRIIAVVSHSEVLKLRVSVAPKLVRATGEDEWPVSSWPGFGLFQGDPTWGELFDEIEHQRDQHWSGESD